MAMDAQPPRLDGGRGRCHSIAARRWMAWKAVRPVSWCPKRVLWSGCITGRDTSVHSRTCPTGCGFGRDGNVLVRTYIHQQVEEDVFGGGGDGGGVWVLAFGVGVSDKKWYSVIHTCDARWWEQGFVVFSLGLDVNWSPRNEIQ